MPRETSAQSDSESERVPSKKQKKAESPVDDPMDEDGGDNEEAEEDEGEGEEYEIEAVLDSSNSIFRDEMAYFVKWKGYSPSENSWVKESDAPNAGELISQFMDRRHKEKAAEKKKAAAKSRKSSDRPQDYKKRGRVSTKPKPDSDEESERSPVQPTTKKQKKTTASAKNKESREKEDASMGQFTSMEKYMDLDQWDDLISKVETIERDDDGILYLYGTTTTGDTFRLPTATANTKFPQKVIKFYEDNLRWRAVDGNEVS